MGDVTPLTDAERDALVDAAEDAAIDITSDEGGWLKRSVKQAHGHVTLRALANPSAILSWSARDAAQMRRIAELEAQLDTARADALREVMVVVNELTPIWDHVGPVPATVRAAWTARDNIIAAIRALIASKEAPDAE